MTNLQNGKWFWAYLDDQGKIHVKKYVSDWDIQKVEQLPFCVGIFDPFFAINKTDAQIKIMEFLDNEQYHAKTSINN
jgi:hypothetical protein